MNKGIFIHIIATIVFIAATIFVFNGENITKEERLGAVVIFVVYHAFIFCCSMAGELYKEEI